MDRDRIRPIAICLFRSAGRLLVSEGFDASERVCFCRPLGGGIEFGERSHSAVVREIREELGLELESLKLIGVLENIFSYEGRTEHEIVFVYDAEFADKSLYERDEIRGYRQETRTEFVARWRSVAEIERNNIRLVPHGLADLMKD